MNSGFDILLLCSEEHHKRELPIQKEQSDTRHADAEIQESQQSKG